LCNGVKASYVFNIVSGNPRMFAGHWSSGHESLEGRVSKSQQGQQNVLPRVTAEETSHQGNKSQLMVPKIREMDGERCKTSHDSYLSVNKCRHSVTESSVQQNNCSKEAVYGSMKNKASDATVQQNDDQLSCSSRSFPEEGYKEIEIREDKGTGKGIVSDEDIQRKSDMAGKNKCLPESEAVLTVASSKESCNISPSAVDHDQVQSSFRSDQLSIGLLDDIILTTVMSVLSQMWLVFLHLILSLGLWFKIQIV
jgi:hypothetical protein